MNSIFFEGGMLDRSRNLIFFILIYGAAACATSTPQMIHLQDAAQVSYPGKAPVQKNAGDMIEITGQPLLIESPGKVSVVVTPAKPADGAKMILSLQSMRAWGGAELETHLNKVTGEIVSEILRGMTSIQRRLASRDLDAALQEVRALRKKYPQAKYLGFVETSALVLLGQKDAARNMLKETLAAFPEDVDGQRLAAEILRSKDRPGSGVAKESLGH